MPLHPLPPRRSWALLAAVGPVALGLAQCSRTASARDCRAMVERYLDLAVRESAGAAAMSPSELAAVRRAEEGVKFAVPSYREVVDRCDEVDRGSVSCALRAPTTAAWEACLGAAARSR